MGSEQGFQVSKIDPESEDQTKKDRKDKLKKTSPKPATEAVDLAPKKSEKPQTEPEQPQVEEEIPTEETSTDTIAEAEQVEDSLRPLETPDQTADVHSEDLTELEEIEEIMPPEKLDTTPEPIFGSPSYETPDQKLVDSTEIDQGTRSIEPFTIDLKEIGQEHEIPLRPSGRTVQEQPTVMSQAEIELPQPVTAEEPFLTPPESSRSESAPPPPPSSNSFEEMVNKVLASDSNDGYRFTEDADLGPVNRAADTAPEVVVARTDTAPVPTTTEYVKYQPVLERSAQPIDRPPRIGPMPRISPIVEANRTNIPAVSPEQFDQPNYRQSNQSAAVNELNQSRPATAEHISTPPSTIFDFAPAPENRPTKVQTPVELDHFTLPEVVDPPDSEPEPVEERTIQRSVWHSIEVDPKTGHAVETPTFNYGLEYNREQAPEHKDEAADEEVAVASGQLAVGGSTNIEMPLPQPILFSLPPNSTQSARSRTPGLAQLSHLELPLVKLPADFRSDIWLWILLGIVVMADFIAIFG